MNIVNAGYNYRHPGDFCINRPEGSGDYIFLVIKSDAYFIINGKKQIVYPNSVIFFKKGTPQNYGALGKEYVNDWIHFELSEKEATEFNKLEIPFDCIITFNDISEFTELIKKILYELYSQGIHKEKLLNLYFEILLLKLSDRIKIPETKTENAYYNAFLNLRNEIYLKPDKDWKISDIEKKLNLSRSYIQHLYKSFFGTSIFSDITSGRINHAKYLLSSTDMSVSCISELCGYKSDIHFMHIFKKTTLLTPTQYRKNKHLSKKEILNSYKRAPFTL